MICFIGAGKMGESLIKGLLDKKAYSKKELFFFEKDPERRSYIEKTYGLKPVQNIADAAASEVIILAVKPQQLNSVLPELAEAGLSGKLIVSIAAGIPLAHYLSILPKEIYLARVMPNILATIGKAVSAISVPPKTPPEVQAKVEKIFSCVGTTVIVDEKQQNAVTALSGSGPAYFYNFAELLIKAGVRSGLSREAASAFVFQTMMGSALMMLETGKHPSVLIDEVTSPGGTTIAALEAFEENGFSKAVYKAVKAAIARAEEIEKNSR